jgi:hypothetical protein
MGSDVMKGTCDDGGGDTGLCRLSILLCCGVFEIDVVTEQGANGLNAYARHCILCNPIFAERGGITFALLTSYSSLVFV